ncbi:HAD-IIIC family phosphatase [Corallococcus caeni]|uniref:HAD-IIIC family phosphatase n=1 Tax=Corallococcus caeni TaxID=3082388 RepID=UPI0030C75563
MVWDLDDTLWQGTLLEGDALVLTPGVKETIIELDRRGILQSIASKNDHAAAWERLTAYGLDEYFLHPQIGWTNKSESLRTLAEQLGIGTNALALVDDQPFERDEVRFSLPEVLTIDAADISLLLHLPALQPRFVTSESRLRRRMYKADLRRKLAEETFSGTGQDFLATLGTVITIRVAREEDLRRAEELTVRTSQLNATGRTYSHAELHALLYSRDHLVLVCELEDRYGSAGTIGLSLVELGQSCWILKLLIVSCRVVSRGVGGIMLTHILQAAKRRGVKLRALFVPTDRNRMMYVTYKFNGFVEVGEEAGTTLLEHPLQAISPYSPHLTVRLPDDDHGLG